VQWSGAPLVLDGVIGQPGAAQPVKTEGRGHELRDLEGSSPAWNAAIQPDGRIVPQIARL